MEKGDNFTHQGIEYTATAVDGTTIKGMAKVTVAEVHTIEEEEVSHSKVDIKRICIEEGDITP